MSNLLTDYLKDLVSLLRERAEVVKKESNLDDGFEKGRSMGLYEALDLIKQQALAFEISLEEIGLSGINLENLL